MLPDALSAGRARRRVAGRACAQATGPCLHRRRGIAGGAVRKPLAGKAGGRGKRRPPGRPGPGCGVAVRHRRPRPDEAAGQDRSAGASCAKRCPAGLGLVSDPSGRSLCRAGSARRPRVPTLTGGRGLLEPGPAGSPGEQRSAGGRPWGPAGRVGPWAVTRKIRFKEDFVARSCENSVSRAILAWPWVFLTHATCKMCDTNHIFRATAYGAQGLAESPSRPRREAPEPPEAREVQAPS